MLLNVDVDVKYAGINFQVNLDYNTKEHVSTDFSIYLNGTEVSDIINAETYSNVITYAHTAAKQVLIDEGYLNASDF